MLKGTEGNIIFMLTRDDLLDCASELEICRERVTDNVIELVKRKINLGLGNWPEVVRRALKEAIGCPLGLVCYPSCFWWKEGECTFPRGDREPEIEKGQ